MEIIFTDLIARSYLLYTKNNDNDIAHFYYKEQVKVKEGNNKDFFFSKKEFYNKLITNIELLIKISFYKGNAYEISDIPEDYIKEYMNHIHDWSIQVENDLQKQQLDLNRQGENIDLINYNWDECNDAYKLGDAVLNKFVTLKDPVAFIDPSDSISTKTLVLRKSKLEYLKSEAERARKVTSIDELDEIPVIEIPAPSVVSTSLNKNDSSIQITVQNAFKFTLTDDPWKKKKILSQQDYNSLVKWVTVYFENNFTLPKVKDCESIKRVNTAKGNIIQAFKDLFTKLHPSLSKSKPKNFYKLIKMCFYQYREDKLSNIEKAKPSLDYDRLIKQTPKI